MTAGPAVAYVLGKLLGRSPHDTRKESICPWRGDTRISIRAVVALPGPGPHSGRWIYYDRRLPGRNETRSVRMECKEEYFALHPDATSFVSSWETPIVVDPAT